MTHDLRVERVYAAAPEVVFDAFTDPEAQKEMYADEPGWIVRSECDLRAGGRWTIEFVCGGGSWWNASGSALIRSSPECVRSSNL